MLEGCQQPYPVKIAREREREKLLYKITNSVPIYDPLWMFCTELRVIFFFSCRVLILLLA